MDQAVLGSTSEAVFSGIPALEAPEFPPPSCAQEERHHPCDELLIAAGLGDRSSFQALYKKSSAQLFSVVRRAVWQRGEAEEVLQEVYLKIWRHAAAFDASQSHALTWMSRIARNHAIDHLRRSASRLANGSDRQHGDDSETAEDTGIDAAPRPDEWLELEQQRVQVDRLLATLTGMQRQVVLMSFREGCSHSDIAEQLGAPLGSVKSWMRRALQQLKVAIEMSEQGRNGSNA